MVRSELGGGKSSGAGKAADPWPIQRLDKSRHLAALDQTLETV